MSVKSQDDIPLADADDADAIVDEENTNNMRTGNDSNVSVYTVYT